MFPRRSFLPFHDSKLIVCSAWRLSASPLRATSCVMFDLTESVYLRLIDAFSYGWVMPQTDWCWHVWPGAENNMRQACWEAGAQWQAVQVLLCCPQGLRGNLDLFMLQEMPALVCYMCTKLKTEWISAEWFFSLIQEKKAGAKTKFNLKIKINEKKYFLGNILTSLCYKQLTPVCCYCICAHNLCYKKCQH